MATQEQIELSTFIKNVHLSLRNKSNKVGYDLAWNEHCQDANNLEKYAASMKKLATQYWENNKTNCSKVISRINWAYSFCNQYFYGGGLRHQRQKEQDILQKVGLAFTKAEFLEMSNDSDKLELLDVGSCYNPFKIYECFQVLAIDIAPACDDVYKCDFINVSIGDSNNFNHQTIEQFKQNSFHVIVFSLLLEYLPSPEQRLLCCQKAYDLLRSEGILIIITPDSNHVGANAKYMKSWRNILSLIGFSRIKYEKLPHIHCMVFRKAINSAVAKRWSKLYANKETSKELFHSLHIPQDFQVAGDDTLIEIQPKNKSDNKLDCNLLLELPFGTE